MKMRGTPFLCKKAVPRPFRKKREMAIGWHRFSLRFLRPLR